MISRKILNLQWRNFTNKYRTISFPLSIDFFDAIAYLQEEAWRTTLEELGLKLGMKLDKGEFDPLKDFVNKKIKSLQDRVKELIALRQEQEAAGTKQKLLK